MWAATSDRKRGDRRHRRGTDSANSWTLRPSCAGRRFIGTVHGWRETMDPTAAFIMLTIGCERPGPSPREMTAPAAQRAGARSALWPAYGNQSRKTFMARSAQQSSTSPTVLSQIHSPSDLKRRPVRELEQLAGEIRQELIETVTTTGGHLGASLGAVELTIALHYVFDSPRDRLVWDVGHQAYVHKLLTGRRDRFNTIRQEGGLSGFLSRDESAHDAFGAGHASTSISAALGMIVGQSLRTKPAERGEVVAIIGDGALAGGMAFEALNNAGNLNLPLIVVLNDNEM